MKSKLIKSFCLFTIAITSLVSCDEYEDYDLSAPTPIVEFDLSVDGYTATFTNKSQNATHYLWEFGDGFTSLDKNPTYTFEVPGDSIQIRLSAFTEGYYSADFSVAYIDLVGKTGSASNFVGDYEGLIAPAEGESLPFSTTTTAVAGEEAIMFGNLLKANRLQYESWGYLNSKGTDDFAKIIFKENGVIEIPLQYMYHLDGNGYVDNVYIVGKGSYRADTGAISLEYIELFEGDGLDWDGKTITEKVIIARKQ
ncbi:PKD domain-containing protein [Polaribacter sp. Z014]|uniref:PKD domain-containing protein n=1 Tax=Polaribacter sp. Z014 TaxID=2927126 RepID=UPI002021B0A1|nr:PKD domain-containing protein [Polaribacter sp. Z014]MCL7764473.1 PKD domain-containing protein [Polaribacter sp. Z014]